MRNVCLIMGLLFYYATSSATVADTAHAKKDKVRIKPIPVISYAPETKFLFGVGALTTFQLYKDTTTHHSLVAAFLAYTQNKQDYVYVPYQIYTKDDRFYFDGEADYYNYSYYYWGIGTNRVAKELYDVHFPRLQLNAYRKLTSHFFAGIDYYLENDIIVGTQAGGELSKGIVPGSTGSLSSGLGIDLLYDTRDSIYYPSKGWYIKANSYFNGQIFGANYDYDKVITDFNFYTKVAKPVVLAFNEHTQFCWGNVPFDQLSMVGGSRPMQLRGYYYGYYRDDILTYLQAEARIHLFWRFGFDVFGSVGLLGNYNVFPESNSPFFAEGVGLRYNYDVKQHVNIRLDAGYGDGVEFYLTIQEAF